MLIGILIGLTEFFPLGSHDPFYWLLNGTRLLLGIPFVLYLPGYLLQSVLFPLRSDLDKIERVGLSLGLSVALVTLLVLLLNALPWGLRPWPIIISQLCLIVVLILMSALVRKFMPADHVYSPQVRPRVHAWWVGLTKSEKSVMVVMAGMLIMAMVIAGWIFFTPSSNTHMTEFYILGQEGLAEDYPREITAGQVVTVTTGITNREEELSTYNIQIKLNDQVIGQAGPITLENNATWEQPTEFSIPIADDDQQVRFVLEREGKPSPYRTLLLWMNVKPAEAP